ncbi:transposase [Anoxybacillus voinovskiensis]|uniref:Transposase n=1 Tax=Anoxybacteroides voinovskiense TaxID=230470 RepID=A0A840DQE4_9BACL|nr:IS1182 family transposase [Anoxybacillus voinovskiensis]MBB4075294.1 transposase [Anoxybacillus voinovskiensis]GGJ77885.1 transposase [Anoxybacillus voinovskiensis]
MKHHHISFKEYTMDNLTLPSNIADLIPPDNMAHVVHEMVECIPMEAFLPYYKGGGTSSYHPKMMTKIILYAYTQKMYHGREIARQLEVHLPLMWLSGFQKPDFRSINRFRSERMKGLMDDLFREMITLLVADGYVNMEDYFVDGTKIEANANPYTFVWRKSAEKYQEKLQANVDQLIAQIDAIVEEENAEEIDASPAFTSKEIREKTEEWEKRLEVEPDNRPLKKAVKKMKKDYLPRSEKYELQLQVCGDRNSYSKTDEDAAFMRLKEDHMRNGQLKPAYNVQVGSSDPFILGYSLHQRPGDTRCLLPHLETVQEKYGVVPKRVTADAVYGSEENYVKLEEKNISAFIKYNTYEKENTRKVKKNPHHPQNWTYNQEEDVWICANGKKLVRTRTSKQTTESGYTSVIHHYQCHECERCPFRSACTTSKYGRTMQWNPVYHEQKQKARERLESEEGQARYRQRQTDIESVFGQIKQNRGFRRFVLRGLQKISIEWGLICTAHNLLKKAAKDKQRALAA